MKSIQTLQALYPITYEIAQSAEMICEAKQLCHDVYLQVGYIDKPLPGRIIPYQHDSASTYIVALNSLRQVVGTIRLTAGPPFNTLNIWKDRLYISCSKIINDALDGNSFEIGALAVRKDFSSMKISWGLYKSAYKCAQILNMEYAIISIDSRALRSLEMLGWYVIKIGEPMYYFGSLTVPGILPLKAQVSAIQSKNQASHKLIAA
jgi:hypothetical protein